MTQFIWQIVIQLRNVESSTALDQIFGALADVTRRDILKRVSNEEQTIGSLAEPYAISLAAIAKHIGVLEKVGLITKPAVYCEKNSKLLPILSVNPLK